MGQIIRNDDIISYNCTIKLNYKNCDVVLKRFVNDADMTITIISGKGYIIGKNKTFICKPGYNHILNYLNENINYIDDIYNDIIKKGVQNDNKIMDFEAGQKEYLK